MSTRRWELSAGFTTHPSLLLAAVMNEETAWENVSHIYGPLVYEWLRTCNVPAQDATDVSQKVFLSVFGSLAKFREQGGRFRCWLRTITHNHAMDYHRSSKRVPGTLDPYAYDHIIQSLASMPEPDEAADARIPDLVYSRALELLRNRFESKSLDIACLVLLDKQSPTKVAAEVGCSRNAVYKVVSRVRHALREILQGLEF